MGSFLWYRNYVCKLVLVCFGAFGYILRFGKVQKNGVDTKFTRTCYRMKIGSFNGMVGECAGILKSAILILDLALGCVDRVKLLRG